MDEVFKIGVLWPFLCKLLERTGSSELSWIQHGLFQLLYERQEKYEQAKYGHLGNFPGSIFQCPEWKSIFQA